MDWKKELELATTELSLLAQMVPADTKVVPGEWTFTDGLPDETNVVIQTPEIAITVGELRLMTAIVAARTRIERASPPEPEVA